MLALYRVVTGSWLGTSVEDKSLLASYGVNQGLAIASEYGVDVVRGLLLGLYPSQVPIGIGRGWASLFFPPLALAFIARGRDRAAPRACGAPPPPGSRWSRPCSRW